MVNMFFKKQDLINFLNSQIPMRVSPKRITESISNFIDKTYTILEDGRHTQIVDWLPSGNSFVIKDVKRFQEMILPLYFKHSNFSSFVRQLNMYNFHKVRGERQDCEFEHDKFKKAHRELLPLIKRKQSQSLILSQHNFEEANGDANHRDESQENKKNSDYISSGNIRDELNQKDQTQELQLLREENLALKRIKQGKLDKRKELTSSIPNLAGEKFFKLVTALMAQKIQKELKIEKDYSIRENKKICSFEQILDHVLNDSMPDSFKDYSYAANEMCHKQTEYDFMMRK